MSRLSHDSWGRRRNGGTWNGNPAASAWTTITNTTRHGFTSHEMLDNLNLVHMNGRVYDQVIGRFMSADPFIDGAGNTQGWNRYAYVHGNPLNSWDPSGYRDDDKVIVNCQNCDKLPAGIEGVIVTASRGTSNNSNFAAAMHSGAVRSVAGGEIGGGGVIAHVVTTASRLRARGSAAPPPAASSNGGEKCSSPLPPSLDPTKHTEGETAAIMQQVRDQGFFDTFNDHRGSGRFDFIANMYSDDSFSVHGTSYNASQFGNFLAGYSGAYHYGFIGYSLDRTAGITYDLLQYGSNTDFDQSSVPYIRDGAALGQLDRDLGVVPTSGCGTLAE